MSLGCWSPVLPHPLTSPPLTNPPLRKEDVRKVFAPFGAIREIVMSFDTQTNRSKGFCFVDFAQPESAAMALQTMNGFQLAGRAIKVGRPTAGATAQAQQAQGGFRVSE